MLLWALGNQTTSAWRAGVEPTQTPQLAGLAAFPVPRQVLPVVVQLPVLRLLCADETCSVQWTICVNSGVELAHPGFW